MKTVLLDLKSAQPMGASKYHGGGEYTKAIYYELYKKYIDGLCLYVLYDSSLFIDDWIVRTFDHKNINIIDISNKSASVQMDEIGHIDVFFEGIVSHMEIEEIKHLEADISIGVYHGLRSLEIIPGNDMTEILYMDTLMEKMKFFIKRMTRKKYYNFMKDKLKKQLEKYDYLIADSMHSVYSLKVFFPELATKKIELIFPAPKHIESNNKAKIRDNNTILMLNSDRWTKNAFRGIKALDSLFSDGFLDDYTVHITGKIPNQIEKRIINKHKFKSIGYVSPEELEEEYATCHLFFYPTLNEGFGYPPIEAMRYGKTCLISCNSSLPELFSGYVYFCNHLDINEIKTRLLMACDNLLPLEKITKKYTEIFNRQTLDTERILNLIIED